MADDVETVAEVASEKVEGAGALAAAGAVAPVEVFDKAILGDPAVVAAADVGSVDVAIKQAVAHELADRKASKYQSALRSELVAVVECLLECDDIGDMRARLRDLGLSRK